MKLIFCPYCTDVVRLFPGEWRRCKCKKVGGTYKEDGLHAEITKKAVPLGFNNYQFLLAMSNRPKEGMGERFEAFIIPDKCDTIQIVDFPDKKKRTKKGRNKNE